MLKGAKQALAISICSFILPPLLTPLWLLFSIIELRRWTYSYFYVFYRISWSAEKTVLITLSNLIIHSLITCENLANLEFFPQPTIHPLPITCNPSSWSDFSLQLLDTCLIVLPWPVDLPLSVCHLQPIFMERCLQSTSIVLDTLSLSTQSCWLIECTLNKNEYLLFMFSSNSRAVNSLCMKFFHDHHSQTIACYHTLTLQWFLYIYYTVSSNSVGIMK